MTVWPSRVRAPRPPAARSSLCHGGNLDGAPAGRRTVSVRRSSARGAAACLFHGVTGGGEIVGMTPRPPRRCQPSYRLRASRCRRMLNKSSKVVMTSTSAILARAVRGELWAAALTGWDGEPRITAPTGYLPV
jgi:hypothetical protein